MSRISYSEEEDYPGQFGLWNGNVVRSIKSRQGQASLRELEAALLALPDKRLIAGLLRDKDGEVCGLGALALYKGHELVADEPKDNDEYDEIDLSYEMEEFGVSLGMPRLVAWKIVAKNDIDFAGQDLITLAGPYRWPSERPTMWADITPEQRYERMLRWVQRQLTP